MMPDSSLVWKIILIGGSITYALRILPFVIFKAPKNSKPKPFIDVAVTVMIGGLISTMMFHQLNVKDLSSDSRTFLLRSTVLLGSFFVAQKINVPLGLIIGTIAATFLSLVGLL